MYIQIKFIVFSNAGNKINRAGLSILFFIKICPKLFNIFWNLNSLSSSLEDLHEIY